MYFILLFTHTYIYIYIYIHYIIYIYTILLYIYIILLYIYICILYIYIHYTGNILEITQSFVAHCRILRHSTMEQRQQRDETKAWEQWSYPQSSPWLSIWLGWFRGTPMTCWELLYLLGTSKSWLFGEANEHLSCWILLEWKRFGF